MCFDLVHLRLHWKIERSKIDFSIHCLDFDNTKTKKKENKKKERKGLEWGVQAMLIKKGRQGGNPALGLGKLCLQIIEL